MFTHILLPTDGSTLSDMAIEKGIQLARSLHAKVTGLCVVHRVYSSYYDPEIPGGLTEQAEAQMRTDAKVHLAALARVAQLAGVECEVVVETSDQPFEAILMTAEEKGCDLIVMASHGRRGVAGILLGSETQKVLTHSKIPVLVLR
jgi:nucleotide-binding universal stress UspA family protein